MAFFGGGGGGGFGIGTAFGGLSLLGSAFLEFQAQKEKAVVAKEREQQLARQQQAVQIEARREQARAEQERDRTLGTIRARLAGQGIDLSGGSGKRLLDLTRARFDQDEDDADKLRELERQGFTSAIGAARRSRELAGLNQYLGPTISLIGGLGEL